MDCSSGMIRNSTLAAPGLPAKKSGLRSSEMDSLATRPAHLYGPEPTGVVCRLSTATSDGTIPVLTAVSPDGKDASGCFRCTTTLVGDGASMEATDARYERELALFTGSMIFSYVYFTSAESSAEPLLNLSPSLSVNV